MAAFFVPAVPVSGWMTMAGGVVGVVGGVVVVLGRRREQHTLPATHTSLQIQCM